MKRFLAMACLLAVVLSATVALMAPVSAEQAEFEAGFARVDINPYIDPNKTGRDLTKASNIMQLPLRGTGDVWNRLSTGGILEDNGKIDKYLSFIPYTSKDDGLNVDCIAVTGKSGKTVLMISIDLLYSDLADRAKEEICSRVETALTNGELSDVVLAKEHIYFAATHTHNAPDTTAYSASGKTGTNSDGVDLSVVNTNLGTWIDRTIEDIGDAAILALQDRAPAKLIKDQISASEITAGVASGKVLNSNRHYNNAEDGCVAGDNFNVRGDNPTQVTQANDTMYLLEFDFSEHNDNSEDDKLNIVLANWRGHPSLNNSAYPNHISSDYVNAFRHTLEYGCTVQTNGKETCNSTQDYRVAFFNGAGGNVNPRGHEKIDGVSADAWIDTFAENIDGAKGIGYGRVLAEMAKAGLDSILHKEEVTSGDILTCRYVYNSTRKTAGVSALSYEAAKAFQAAYSAGTVKTPYVYTSATGETFVIGSKYHADALIPYWDPTLQMPKDAIVNLELNVFMLGEGVAFVTTAGEAFDYYYNPDGSNAWDNLVADTYGTPFVLGYCNGGKSYLPNSQAYEYNQGSKVWASGSYESNLTYFEKGTGEHMIELFDQILETLATKGTMTQEKTCAHCNQPVTWNHYDGDAALGTGHYYLIDGGRSKPISIQAGQQVCLDLNGHAYEGQTRAIDFPDGGTVLSVMDLSENQTGKLMGSGANYGAASGFGGAALSVASSNTFNLYSGALTYQQRGIHSARTGGVVDTRGTFNMYGGTITGGVGYSFTGTYLKSGELSESDYVGWGATVFCNGQFNMSGGRIDSGEFMLVTGTVSGDATNGYTYSQTLTPAQGLGPGIYTHTKGSVKISGNAVIEDVYFPASSADKLVIDESSKPFTGSVRLDYAQELTSGTDIGNCTEGMTLNANAITFADSTLVAKVQGTNIYVTEPVIRAIILDAAGNATEYGTLAAAIADYVYSPEDLNYVKLYEGVDTNLTLSKDLYLDLNGYNLGGALTVNNGVTLYCMDSQTDDYTVEDEAGYGKITGTYTGNIQAVPANSVGAVQDTFYRDPYYAVKEADGLSFHRLKLRLPTLSLRPDEVGMYYTGVFGGDEVLAKEVVTFGAILNAYEEPTLNSTTNFWTAADAESWTNDGKLTSVLLTGVMKQSKTEAVNASNANRPVYGRAYVRTKDGYVFSNTISYSLKQLVEKADSTGTIQGEGFTKLVAMYQKYANVMDTWNIPNFRQDMENAG